MNFSHPVTISDFEVEAVQNLNWNERNFYDWMSGWQTAGMNEWMGWKWMREKLNHLKVIKNAEKKMIKAEKLFKVFGWVDSRHTITPCWDCEIIFFNFKYI